MALPKNPPTRLKRSEFEVNRYFVMIEPGVTLDDVMTGDYWMHVRKVLRVNDVIEAVAGDGSFDAELRILSINQNSGAMTFRVLRNTVGKAGPIAKSVAEDRFELKHAGFAKYRITERKTGTVVVDGVDKATAESEKARLEAERVAA